VFIPPTNVASRGRITETLSKLGGRRLAELLIAEAAGNRSVSIRFAKCVRVFTAWTFDTFSLVLLLQHQPPPLLLVKDQIPPR
jgi:hypothetical protein